MTEENSVAKKAKLDTKKVEGDREELLDQLKHFGEFEVEKVLREDSDRRMIVVLGRFPKSKEPQAASIVTLEKTPFGGQSGADNVLKDSDLAVLFRNDIYGKYDCHVRRPENNRIKATVIFPATEKHIKKYTDSPRHIIYETAALYKVVTLPFLQEEQFNPQWIYNILEHKAETDTIVYEDPDPVNGFILLPDYKWNGKQLEDLYLVAIIHRRDIMSVRDLRRRHMPLLKNLWQGGCKAIQEKYGVPSSRIRAYFHYRPSYYHLHVHYSQAGYQAPGINVESAHLLPTVMDNLQRNSRHYADAELAFPIKEAENLFTRYQNQGYNFSLGPGFKSPVVSPENASDLVSFFRSLGKAKHEPCGEHWDHTYGESAWRLAIMAMCLSESPSRKRLVQVALTSAFTSLGASTDDCSEWPEKLKEVQQHLERYLRPLQGSRARLLSDYSDHVAARRRGPVTAEDKLLALEDEAESDALTYRKLLELEETLLLSEELKKDGESPSEDALIKKMYDVGFPGSNKYKLLGDPSHLQAVLKFILQASVLMSLKRTGWVRKGVRHPETVASHMFRMGLMASTLANNDRDCRIHGGDAVIVSICHDIAECVVGDITPQDKVTAEEKHRLEMEAMRTLVKDLPDQLAQDFFNAFERYELQQPGDEAAVLTKDLDKFDMILQADEYERAEGKFFLQEFFDSTVDVFKTEEVRLLADQLRKERSQRQAKP